MGKFHAVVLFLLVAGCSSINPTYRPAGDVSTTNELSYRDTIIKTNPDFKYLFVQDFHKAPDTQINRTYKQITDMHIFLGVDELNRVYRAAIIQIIRFSDPHIRWDHRVNFLKGMHAIEKGRELIDGKQYWQWTAMVLALPEKIFFKIEEEGYRIRNFRCGLEKGVARIIGMDSAAIIIVRYLEGVDDCKRLDKMIGSQTNERKNKIKEFGGRFEENVKISHQ